MTEEKDCVFCKIARKEIKVKIVEESDNFLAFPDANPKVEGHTLIISKKHFVNLLELSALLGNELLDIIKKVGLRYKQDFNVVVNTGKEAGQLVMHFHLHILPRKKGDGLRVAA